MGTPSQPNTSTGRYDVGEVLGAGGMGVIHRAHDRLANREVAYKRLKVSIEVDRPRLGALFRREYDTLARLHHPNIVSVYDYGFDELGPYYAMELLPGDDLAKLAPLSVREACRVLRDVASALALVHARRLIHRDVSPNNVRLSQAGQAKLLDFGALTSFGSPTEVVGTPAFIAPECLSETPLDGRTDLYALGALAYWTLTRRLAVRAYSLEELPDAWQKPIAPPSTYAPEVPRELDNLILALLQQDRAARPSSAAEVIERLTNIAELAPEQDEERVAHSYLEHTPLCGRALAVNDLRRALDEVKAGRGTLLMIEGAPGMGRSAMLEQLGIEAQLRGATVLRAEGKLHAGPLGLITHLVQTGLATFPDVAQLFRARDSLMINTATIAPDGGSAKSPLEAAERHGRVAASLQEVLLHIALRAPLVVAIDDAHLADAQSLALLASMGEAVARHPILIALTRLSGPADSNSMALLCAGAKRLALAPLSESELSELSSDMFGQVPNVQLVARWLHEESGGEVATAIALVRALLLRGEIRYARGTFVLPGAIERGLARETLQSSLSRVSDLDGDTLKLAHLLSLEPAAMSIGQLATATGRSAQEVFLRLEQIGERGLLVQAGGKYTLASQTLRAELAASLAPNAAVQLELALARMLTAEPNPSLSARYAAGLHTIRAGGEFERRGADMIAEATREHLYEAALTGTAVPYLEAALAVFRREGRPDHALLDLLIPLSVAGFYGDLSAQRRHLSVSMTTLQQLTGMALASRLKRWVGARIALIVGLLTAVVWHMLHPSHKRSVRKDIDALLSIASSGIAAEAVVIELEETAKILRWLEPLSAASAGGALAISHEFCLAVAEVAAGLFASANERLQRLLTLLRAPIRGVNERTREQLLCGVLNSLGLANSERDEKLFLLANDELTRQGGFFAPHAALQRVIFHGMRGELEQFELYRGRTEALALLGGVSWSALALLTTTEHQMALMNEDIVMLMRVESELERLSLLGPEMARQHDFARADLLLLRGRPAEACALYESLFEGRRAHASYFTVLARAMFARALRESGAPERARAVCEEALAVLPAGEMTGTGALRSLLQQFALAEAALGQFEKSRARLAELLESALPRQNPLELGSLHRDRATVAILEHDEAAFEQSFAEMKRWFASVANPSLIQQCDVVLMQALSAGMRARSEDLSQTVRDRPDEMDGSTVISPAAPDNDVQQQSDAAHTQVRQTGEGELEGERKLA